MNHAQIFYQALTKASDSNKMTAEATETSFILRIPLKYTVKGKPFYVSVCFEIQSVEGGQSYEESVQVFKDNTRSSFKKIPTRLYISQMKPDAETEKELITELNGLHKELTAKFKPAKIKAVKEVVSTEPKRGPGRPKKEVVETNSVVSQEIATEPEVKRGRGRPRKEVIVSEVAEPKRPRGRPRKEPMIQVE